MWLIKVEYSKLISVLSVQCFVVTQIIFSPLHADKNIYTFQSWRSLNCCRIYSQMTLTERLMWISWSAYDNFWPVDRSFVLANKER